MEEIIKNSEFSIVKNGDRYEIHKREEVLKTPSGKIANTRYLPLAERLLRDWKEKGYDSYKSAKSILSFHFTMVEFYAGVTKEAAIAMLNLSHWENSWTLQGCPTGNPRLMMDWMNYFGSASEQIVLIRQWFNNCTRMQLTAALCVYNAMMDYNIAYFWATVVEELDETEHEEAIREFYDFLSEFDEFYDFEEFWTIFDNFRLYYGIHLLEDGKHLPE